MLTYGLSTFQGGEIIAREGGGGGGGKCLCLCILILVTDNMA